MTTWSEALRFDDAGRLTRQSEPGAPPLFTEHVTQFSDHILREDVVGSAHYLGLLHDAGCGVAVRTLPRGRTEFTVTDGVGDLAQLAATLVDTDPQLPRGRKLPVTAAVVSCAQTFLRRGEAEAAQTFLRAYLDRHGANHVLEDVELAQKYYRSDPEGVSVLVRNLAVGGLAYRQFFAGKHCSRPFDDFTIRFDGEIFSCCPTLVPDSIGNAYDIRSVDELKQSPRVSRMEDSILSGDYRYCRWLHCTVINRDRLVRRPPEAKTKYAPTRLQLAYDPTCNLWCPSCRTEKIVAKGAEQDRIMGLTERLVLPLLKDAERCYMNGFGDVFSSRSCRAILKASNPDDFPRLKYDIITNGVLFSREEWAKFPGIHTMVDSVRVSVDAARRETYQRLRLGGDWDILLTNLHFIAELRRRRTIARFTISMVVQEDNLDEVEAFAALGQELGCDVVIFEPLMNWNSYSLEELRGQSVHDPVHPRHQDFMRALDRLQALQPPAPGTGPDESATVSAGRTAVKLGFRAADRWAPAPKAQPTVPASRLLRHL